MRVDDVCVVIPARLAASRLPGKPLLPLGGVPLVEHVRRRCRAAGYRTIVATPDPEIGRVIEAFGGEWSLTAPAPSGTARVAALALDARVVVNVQGDQPLIAASHLHAVVAAARPGSVATLARPCERPSGPEQVTVVVDDQGRALYFSRCAIPCGGPWRAHVGVYGFGVGALARVAALPRGPLARAEDLEQLDWLAAGVPMPVVEVDVDPGAVDTPAQYTALSRRFDVGELVVPTPIVG